MKIHVRYLLALTFSLVFFQSIAQTITDRNEIGWTPRLPEKVDINIIEGTPYLHDEFVIGEVYFDKKYKTTPILVRLNLHNDELEYIENDVEVGFTKLESIDKLVMGDEVFVFVYNGKFNSRPSGFLKMWSAKTPSLLTKMKIYCFADPRIPFTFPKPTRFERVKDEHYIMKSADKIIKITSVKKLINILGDHSAELTKVAEEENISVENGGDLSRLLDYYHQLSEQNL